MTETQTPDDLVLAVDDLGEGWLRADQALDGPVPIASPDRDPATDGLVNLPSRVVVVVNRPSEVTAGDGAAPLADAPTVNEGGG